MTISEEKVLDTLREALAGAPDRWTSARFILADQAERGERTIVAAARTTTFDELKSLAGIHLRPYGVHHHVLVVGWTPSADGIQVDVGRYSPRGR